MLKKKFRRHFFCYLNTIGLDVKQKSWQFESFVYIFTQVLDPPGWLNVERCSEYKMFRIRQEVKFLITFRCSRAFCMHTMLSDVVSDVESTMNWTILTGQSTNIWQKFTLPLLKLKSEHVFTYEMRTCSCVDQKDAFSVVRFIFGVWLKDGLISYWSPRLFREREEPFH